MASTVLAHREHRMISTVVVSCWPLSIAYRDEEPSEDVEEDEDEGDEE